MLHGIFQLSLSRSVANNLNEASEHLLKSLKLLKMQTLCSISERTSRMLSHRSLEICLQGRVRLPKRMNFRKIPNSLQKIMLQVLEFFGLKTTAPSPFASFPKIHSFWYPDPFLWGMIPSKIKQNSNVRCTKLFLYICKSILRGLKIDV